MIRENLLFFKEFLQEFENTGTCFPTSRQAARALAQPVLESCAPKKILELGPGTGSVTVEILRAMREGDELAICEINPRFMEALKERLHDNPDYIRHRARIRFFQCAAQELPENQHYDVIVCALPFLNFTPEVVAEIFQKIERLSHPDSVMTYYEYIGLRKLGMTVAAPPRKQRIKEINNFYRNLASRWRISRRKLVQHASH
ncbi:MAG: methyltransferase domain-containing protein [Bdellovibrionota bacterium]|nr:MAG: methyltransferase domain-containing protein [Bdellovibrionota bacterium]